MDGSVQGTWLRSGFGELCDYHGGVFLFDFFGRVQRLVSGDAALVLHVEILVLHHGFRHDECLSDSLVLVNLLWCAPIVIYVYANELMDIRNLMAKDWDCSLSHSLREDNMYANALTKFGVL
ncbi:uncharacterized protein LOC109803818 [Cajanus cajan]|uniref:RNase H type-1 domain-containing protein n=1 Tax=Cajanus cajan TaxID=3821 RepID=A0A151T6C9_CAJCA|nr:uncharacterized protein LOC109803818 [Cajanus cajan]KYP62609.1 hypothetical protein KK1_017150 [Cajanus cajan]